MQVTTTNMRRFGGALMENDMQTEKMVQITVAEGRTIWNDVVTRDAEGRATKQVRHRYKPGQTIEVEESEAKRLMDSGHAVIPLGGGSAAGAQGGA